MYKFIIPSLVAAIGWGVSPFFEKIAVKNTDYQTVLAFKGMFYGIFGIILFLTNVKHFMKIKDKYEVIKGKKISILYISFISVIFSYIVGNFAYLFAIGQNNKSTILVPLVSYVMPLVLMPLISYFAMNEKLNFKMLIGIGITIFGIIFTLLNADK